MKENGREHREAVLLRLSLLIHAGFKNVPQMVLYSHKVFLHCFQLFFVLEGMQEQGSLFPFVVEVPTGATILVFAEILKIIRFSSHPSWFCFIRLNK